VFRQEYGGEFIEGSGQVFRYVRECATGAWKEPVKDHYYYAGLDLAKTEDYTVVVIMSQDREVVFVDRFHRLDWNLQVNRIHGHVERYNEARVFVDSTGSGEPVYEALRHAGVHAKPYTFTSRSKAALVDNLSIMLERRQIVLPRADVWPEGIDELEGFQFSVTDAGHISTGSPAGQHDDCVIALALAAMNVGPVRPGPRIWRL
jgi:hypothetical protein